jgi:hypothetical protein
LVITVIIQLRPSRRTFRSRSAWCFTHDRGHWSIATGGLRVRRISRQFLRHLVRRLLELLETSDGITLSYEISYET